MQIIKDNLNDMDCVMIQHMLQTRASKNTSDTLKYATKVVEGILRDLQKKQEEERQRQKVVLESWQEQARGGSMRNPKDPPTWSGILGDRESAASNRDSKSPERERLQ